MTTSSTIEAPASTCPTWCVNGSDCDAEHWSEPGCERWPSVRASAYSSSDTPDVTAHPVWCARDDSAPAVALWMTGDRIDHTIDLTPDEAIALAINLLRAAEAVKQG